MCHSVKLIKIAGTSGLSNLHGASNSQSQRIRCHSKLSARVLASKIKTYVNTGEGNITELMRHSFLSSQHKILQSQSMYESDKVSRNYRSYYPFRSNYYPGRSFIWKMVKSDFNKKLVKEFIGQAFKIGQNFILWKLSEIHHESPFISVLQSRNGGAISFPSN